MAPLHTSDKLIYERTPYLVRPPLGRNKAQRMIHAKEAFNGERCVAMCLAGRMAWSQLQAEKLDSEGLRAYVELQQPTAPDKIFHA